jgi:hypothetical protein
MVNLSRSLIGTNNNKYLRSCKISQVILAYSLRTAILNQVIEAREHALKTLTALQALLPPEDSAKVCD